MALFDDFDWGSVGSSIIKTLPATAAAVYGSNVASRANTNAANVAAMNAQQRIAATQAAIQQAQEINAPAISHFRAEAGVDPSVLTPAQKIAEEDTKRNFNNKNLIGTVGGRSYSRMQADTVARQRAAAIEANRARATDAAKTGASLSANQGTQLLAGNRDVTGIAGNAADAVGNAITGTGKVQADTFGQIANYFANSTKDADRESRYKEYKDARA